MSKTQFQKYRSANNVLDELFKNRHNVIFIHYSCESFYDRPDGSSPRITSIAARFLGSGQTKSFSIHQQAELSNFIGEKINEEYDNLEKEMLKKFYLCVEQFALCKWVHWNMRDSNYGFEAIAHRFRVLCGTPIDIQDNNKIDLANLMYDLLGPKYVSHPRLYKLLKRNDMIPRNFLLGDKEATAFENAEYVKLHQSTLSKVDAIMNLAEAAIEDRLICDNGYFSRRGFTLSTIGAIIKDHPAFIGISILAVISALIANTLKIFGP